MMGTTLLDDAIRAVIRAELNDFFEEKLKPLLEARQQAQATKVLHEGALYVSTTQAAKMVGVSVGTIQAWVRSNRLPAHKAGRLLRIKVEDLEAFMTRAVRGEVIDLDAAARRIMLGGRRRPTSR